MLPADPAGALSLAAARAVRDTAGRLLSRLPAARRTAQQVVAHAAAWEASNARALAAAGPLWVVLGDSTAQGVGAREHDGGWVGQLLPRLPVAGGGPPWRVVNLSRSGARTADVVDDQLPRAAGLGTVPDLLTAVVGANDALHTPLARWYADAERLAVALAASPARRRLVATAPRGVREGKARRVNAHLRGLAARHDLLLADLWAVTGPPWRGQYADGWHPNEAGYRRWAEGVARGLGLAPVPGGEAR